MIKRVTCTVSAFVAVGIAAAGCTSSSGGSTDSSGSPAGSSSGNATTASTAPAPASTAALSSADPTNVRRGTQTGDEKVDVLAKVGWRNGAPAPRAQQVKAAQGDRIKVLVSSDSAQNISVSGHPDAASDVDATEPEDVDFTMDKSTITVSIKGKALVTFVS